jgi:hypothetical protein
LSVSKQLHTIIEAVILRAADAKGLALARSAPVRVKHQAQIGDF